MIKCIHYGSTFTGHSVRITMITVVLMSMYVLAMMGALMRVVLIFHDPETATQFTASSLRGTASRCSGSAWCAWEAWGAWDARAFFATFGGGGGPEHVSSTALGSLRGRVRGNPPKWMFSARRYATTGAFS